MGHWFRFRDGVGGLMPINPHGFQLYMAPNVHNKLLYEIAKSILILQSCT